jgi:hypothetical protein
LCGESFPPHGLAHFVCHLLLNGIEPGIPIIDFFVFVIIVVW